MPGKELSEFKSDKDRFFHEMEQSRPDLMTSEVWDYEGSKEIAAEELRPNKVKLNMINSIPMICRETCPFLQSCPLVKKNVQPVGDLCPIELVSAQQFFHDYVEELDVDINRMVEVSLVRDLVDQEIQQMRKTWILAQEDFIQENVVGVDAEGRVITQPGLHKAIDYEDRILKRKEKLRNALLATRESKAKAGTQKVDKAQMMSALMDQAREIGTLKEKELRRRMGLEDVDEYIEAEIIREQEEIEED